MTGSLGWRGCAVRLRQQAQWEPTGAWSQARGWADDKPDCLTHLAVADTLHHDMFHP